MKNPTAQPLYLSDLLATPDPYFNAYGALHVALDGRVIVAQPNAGAYSTQQVFTVGMLNEVIQPYGVLDISIWNPAPASSDEIQLGIRFTYDTAPFETTAQTQALAPSELRQAISSPAEGGLDPETQALIAQVEKVSTGIGDVAAAVGLVNSGIGTLASFADAGIDSRITARTARDLHARLVAAPIAPTKAERDLVNALARSLGLLFDGFTPAEAAAVEVAVTAYRAHPWPDDIHTDIVTDVSWFSTALQAYAARLRDQQAITNAIQALPQDHTDIVSAVQDLGIEALNGFPRMLEDLRLLLFYNHVSNPSEPLATNLANVRHDP